MANFIAYYRVSTNKQGESGLGLEAQRSIINAYVTQHGGLVMSEYTDIESGKNNDREQLNMAISELRNQPKAYLIVAKQCRLTRSVSFISSFLEDKNIGDRLIVAETPKASVFELHIRAVLNEETRRQISSNTKHALAAAKAELAYVPAFVMLVFCVVSMPRLLLATINAELAYEAAELAT